MKFMPLFFLITLPLAAHAELVDIQWREGAYSHKTTIAAKKFLEVCGKLAGKDRVAWQFRGSAPSDFNIHYHVAKDVVYPESRKAIGAAEGILAAPQDQHYCWMWSNRSTQAIEIELNLSQVRPDK
ncbi:MAG: hypothetical protein HY255_07130 [Betaproteobacteria bacterium]|nr:hypothetical protein [Betaproteobacteria bacterium]